MLEGELYPCQNLILDNYRLLTVLSEPASEPLGDHAVRRRGGEKKFFREAFRRKLYESVEVLQSDLDGWLSYYNRDRPHQGYRNMGRRPIERIDEYLKSVRKEG